MENIIDRIIFTIFSLLAGYGMFDIYRRTISYVKKHYKQKHNNTGVDR